jgi:predicted ATP-grasp superfamily ATP-dependent carboligase
LRRRVRGAEPGLTEDGPARRRSVSAVPPRILLTDAEERSVLAACRGLAGAGYAVGAVAARRLALTHWSRRCDIKLVAPDPRVDPAGFVNQIADTLAGGEYALLLPGTEASLLAVSAAREKLEPHVRLGLPPAKTVARALDKVELLAVAERVGLAPPQTTSCQGRDEALAAATALGYPLILKPARSFVASGSALRHVNAVVVENEDVLVNEVERLGSPVLVQRYLAGRAVLSCSGVMGGGALRAFAVARYLRTWPPQAGPSSFSETIPPPSDVERRIESLLVELEWEGIFQVQLLELKPGRIATLDLNPRLFGSLALPIAAGANLPAVWCDWVLGRPGRVPVTARAGVRYRWEEGDLRHLLKELSGGHIRAAGSILRPKAHVVHAYFERGDPGPLVAWAMGVLRRGLRRGKDVSPSASARCG